MLARMHAVVFTSVAFVSASVPCCVSAALPTVYALTPESTALGGALTARAESAGAFGANPAALYLPGAEPGRRFQLGITRFAREGSVPDQQRDSNLQGAFVSQAEGFGWGLGWFSNGQFTTDGRLLASPATPTVYEQTTLNFGLAWPLAKVFSLGFSLDAVDLTTEAGDEEYSEDWGFTAGGLFAPGILQTDLFSQTLGIGFQAGVAYADDVEAELDGTSSTLSARQLVARPATLRAGIELGIFWLNDGLHTRLRFPADFERREYSSLQAYLPAAPAGESLIVDRYSLGADWEFSLQDSPWTFSLRAGAAVEKPDTALLEEVKIVSAGVAVIKGPHTFAVSSQVDDVEGQMVEAAYQYWF
jgi:hypothetical protein